MLEIRLATLQLSSYWLAAHARIDLPTRLCFTLVLSLMPFGVRYEMNLFCTVVPMHTSMYCECCVGVKSCRLPYTDQFLFYNSDEATLKSLYTYHASRALPLSLRFFDFSTQSWCILQRLIITPTKLAPSVTKYALR